MMSVSTSRRPQCLDDFRYTRLSTSGMCDAAKNRFETGFVSLCLESLGGVVGDNISVIHDNDAVAKPFDHIQNVRAVKNRSSRCGQRRQEILRHDGAFNIKPGERLIH